MSENIIMPKLGMTMKEGTVEEWFKETLSNKGKRLYNQF